MNTHTCGTCGKQIPAITPHITKHFIGGGKEYECYECNTRNIHKLERALMK